MADEVAPFLAEAEAAYAAGELGAARGALETALTIDPRCATAWTGFARVLHAQGLDREAGRALARALELAPADPASLVLQAQIDHAAGDAATAEATLVALLHDRPHELAARGTLASILERGNRIAEAERLARAGLRAAPRDPWLNLIVAQCALRDGRLDECGLHLERVLAEPPPAPLDQQAAYLGARLLDARERHDAAFAAFAQANRIAADAYRRSGAPPAETLLQRIAADQRAFGGGWVESWQPLSPPEPLPFRPAFLVGFPRSGTTLLDRILAGHPEVTTLEELPLVDGLLAAAAGSRAGYPHLLASLDSATRAELRARYAAAVAGVSRGHGAVVVDKHPLHMTVAGFLHRIFPEARFLFAERHPYDAALSCFMQEFIGNAAMANFHTLPDTARCYDATLRLWTTYRERLPLAVHAVRYERLLDDFDGEVRAALAHLGLAWDARVAGFAARAVGVRTASYAQVGQPLYASARHRHRHYARHFDAQARELLDPWVERLGYA